MTDPSSGSGFTPPPPEETGDVILETLWGRVLEAWDDDKPHAALLDYALRAERLPEVAGRYRALKEDAEKGERAKKRIDAIVVAATQMMFAQKTPPKPTIPWQITVTALLMCAILIGWTAYAVLRR